MADGGISLEVVLNDLKFTAGMLRAAASQKQFTGEVDKTKAQAAKAEKELDRMAESVKKMTATPLEKYNAELAKLNMLQARGKISATEFARAVEMQKDQLDRATVGTQKLNAATAKTGDSKQSVLEIAGALGLVTTAAGVASLAVNKIGEAWQYAADQADKAASRMDSQRSARRKLNQVAESPEDLDRMMSRVSAASAKYGVSPDTAAAVYADARGGGFEADFEQLLVGDAGVLDARDASYMTKKVKSIYGDKVKDLSAKTIVDMALAAAKPSDVEFEDLSKVIPGAAEGGALLGSSYTETAAAGSVIAGRFKSVDTAGDRLKTFGSKAASDKEMAGKGYLGAMRVLRNMTEEKRAEWLGSNQELKAAYHWLDQAEGEIVERMQVIEGARVASQKGVGEVQKGAERALGSNAIGPSIRKQAAEIERDDVMEQKLGPFRQQQLQALAEVETRNLKRNMSGLQRGYSWMMGRAAMALGGDAESIRYWSGDSTMDAAIEFRSGGRNTGPNGLKALPPGQRNGAADEQKQAADAQKQAATFQLRAMQQLASHTRDLKHRALNAEAMQAIS